MRGIESLDCRMVKRIRSTAVLVREKLALATRSPRLAWNAAWDRVSGIQHASYPRNIHLHLTARCNFRCPMCHIADGMDQRVNARQYDLPLETVRRVLEESRPYGPFINFFGGEPLLYPELEEALRLARANHLVACITTNGLLLPQKADLLGKSGLEIVRVSLDGWDEASQTLRGNVPGSFEAISRGLQYLREKYHPFPLIRVNTVITESNYHSLHLILKHIYSLGVRRWTLCHNLFGTPAVRQEYEDFQKEMQFTGCLSLNIIREEEILSKQAVSELKASLAEVREMAPPDMAIEYGWAIDVDKYYSPLPPDPGSVCNYPYSRLDIHSDGRICVCLDSHKLGSVESTSIQEAWTGAEMVRFREALQKNRILPMCFRCSGLQRSIKFSTASVCQQSSDPR